MHKKFEDTDDVFDSPLPETSLPLTEDEQDRLEANAAHSAAIRARHAERCAAFLGLPMDQKFRLLWISNKELRKATLEHHIFVENLVKNLDTILTGLNANETRLEQRLHQLEVDISNLREDLYKPKGEKLPLADHQEELFDPDTFEF